ncbi:hypothetical protein PC117_g28030 [Phytophthora cactorum]|uniref:Reverse transcriptase domain-containing protein n=1 Tax=Phytophthora cactorum TaxID=29920 RepID=A0A8T1A7A7_9STRA|nr:hypothetical protein PC117_g28030 [Phytophthora cactorum]
MTKSTIYSALDLRDGFYQILMRESDIALTAMRDASIALGARLRTELLRRRVRHIRAVNGKTDDEVHKEHLRKLLGLMRKHKLYANMKRCIFGERDIPILGCFVGKYGVCPDSEKVRVISEWPTLSNVKELRQFLGLATYLCKCVENYAGKIRPLSQLLKKEAEWKWTTGLRCSQAGLDRSADLGSG